MASQCFTKFRTTAALVMATTIVATTQLASAVACVDYDPPPGGGPWPCCGVVFFPDGVRHETAPFRFTSGAFFAGGFTEIWNACNGAGGHSLNINNINVNVDARDFFGAPGGPGVRKFKFWYEDSGGSVNLGVNGDLEWTANNFHMIPPGRFAGVGAMLTHSAVWTGTSWVGTVEIEALPGACIDRVTIGGQELCIDDVCGDVECGSGIPCPGDFDANGTVGVGDLLTLLSVIGPCAGCPEDLDGDGDVDISDLLALLASFGPCP